MRKSGKKSKNQCLKKSSANQTICPSFIHYSYDDDHHHDDVNDIFKGF